MQSCDRGSAAGAEVSALVSGRAKRARRESVVDAVRADVAELGVLPRGTRALVVTAVRLAEQLDVDGSATSRSYCAKALAETMGLLRQLAPVEVTGDAVDELTERRDRRQAKVAGR